MVSKTQILRKNSQRLEMSSLRLAKTLSMVISDVIDSRVELSVSFKRF